MTAMKGSRSDGLTSQESKVSLREKGGTIQKQQMREVGGKGATPGAIIRDTVHRRRKLQSQQEVKRESSWPSKSSTWAQKVPELVRS